MTLAVLKGDQTLVQLAQRFDVYPYQVTHWKAQLLERAAKVIAGERAGATPVDVKELHAKIGQLALENDFLAGAFGRLHGPSAKRRSTPSTSSA